MQISGRSGAHGSKWSRYHDAGFATLSLTNCTTTGCFVACDTKASTMVKTASALTAALANTSVTTIYVAAGEYVGNFTIGRNLTLIGAGKDETISVPNTAKATELIVGNPNVFTDFEVTKGKMDDVFLAVTKKTLSGGIK